MFSEIIQCIFGTMDAIFEAFLSLLPFYKQLNELNDQMIAYVLGIPSIVIGVVGVVLKLFVPIFKHR